MRKNIIIHYFKEASIGVLRNKKVYSGIIVIIGLLNVIVATLFAANIMMNKINQALKEQEQIFVFVKEHKQAVKIKDTIKKSYNVEKIELKTGGQVLKELSDSLPESKAKTLNFLKEKDIPYVIAIKGIEDKKMLKEIENMLFVEKISHPTNLMGKLEKGFKQINTTLYIFTLCLSLALITMTNIAIRLALLSRKKQIKIKMLLGAKNIHIKSQMLLETFKISFIGLVTSNILFWFLLNIVNEVLLKKIELGLNYNTIEIIKIMTISSMITWLITTLSSYFVINNFTKEHQKINI